MRRLSIGIIDLIANAPKQELYPRLFNAGFSSLMPQVIAVWCEQAGHHVTLISIRVPRIYRKSYQTRPTWSSYPRTILFSLGVVVFVLKPHAKTSWGFFLLCLSLGGYMVTSFEGESTYYFVKFHHLCLCFFPATFFHLGLIFPEKKPLLIRHPSLEYVVYFPALIIAAFHETFLFTYPHAPTWMPSVKGLAAMARAFQLVCVASLVAFIIYSLFRAATSQARQPARVILFGVTMAFGPPTVLMLLSPFMDVNFPWNFLVFFVILFPASIAYSIVKHNLFDADTIIRRTVGYAVVTAAVIGAYAVVSLGLNVLVGKYEMSQSPAFPIHMKKYCVKSKPLPADRAPLRT